MVVVLVVLVVVLVVDGGGGPISAILAKTRRRFVFCRFGRAYIHSPLRASQPTTFLGGLVFGGARNLLPSPFNHHPCVVSHSYAPFGFRPGGISWMPANTCRSRFRPTTPPLRVVLFALKIRSFFVMLGGVEKTKRCVAINYTSNTFARTGPLNKCFPK